MKQIKAFMFFLLFFSLPVYSYANPYYEGKTLTIVVGYKPAGGYDRVARLLAKYLPKYIPGNPTIIIQNMPGGSSIIAANHIYNIAKADGFTIGTFNRNLTLAQLTGVEGVKFDLTKFAWIGSAASETTVLTVRSDLPYKSFDDLRKAKEAVVVGAIGIGSNTHDFPLMLREFAGANLRIVTGYISTPDIILAIERKEVDLQAGSYSSLKPWIDRGLLRPLVRSRGEESEIAKLPVDEELATSAKGKAIMAVRAAPERIGRPYAAPPKTPESVMKILREAFAQAAKDKELLVEADKVKIPVEYVAVDECLKVIKEVLNQPPDMAKEITKYMQFGD